MRNKIDAYISNLILITFLKKKIFTKKYNNYLFQNVVKMIHLNIIFLFRKGGSSTARRFSPVRTKSSGITSGPRCIHRRQKRAFPIVPAHGLQKYEEIFIEMQV